MAYPKVKVFNSTPFEAKGTVEYASVFCSNDDYKVKSYKLWEATSRGVCLLTKISAIVKTDIGDIQATPYTSVGTTYSDFSIVAGPNNTYRVTRNVSATNEPIPVDHVEPTTKQK